MVNDAAIIFVGQLRGGYKLSFRSRCDLDCNEIALQFGGALAGALETEIVAVNQNHDLPVPGGSGHQRGPFSRSSAGYRRKCLVPLMDEPKILIYDYPLCEVTDLLPVN